MCLVWIRLNKPFLIRLDCRLVPCSLVHGYQCSLNIHSSMNRILTLRIVWYFRLLRSWLLLRHQDLRNNGRYLPDDTVSHSRRQYVTSSVHMLPQCLRFSFACPQSSHNVQYRKRRRRKNRKCRFGEVLTKNFSWKWRQIDYWYIHLPAEVIPPTIDVYAVKCHATPLLFYARLYIKTCNLYH
jgi:hypothetical protein